MSQFSTQNGAQRHCQALWFTDPSAQGAFHLLLSVPHMRLRHSAEKTHLVPEQTGIFRSKLYM